MIINVSKTEEIRGGWIKLLHKELHNSTLRQVLYRINILIQLKRMEIRQTGHAWEKDTLRSWVEKHEGKTPIRKRRLRSVDNIKTDFRRKR
jgi:hypothetical protein